MRGDNWKSTYSFSCLCVEPRIEESYIIGSARLSRMYPAWVRRGARAWLLDIVFKSRNTGLEYVRMTILCMDNRSLPVF